MVRYNGNDDPTDAEGFNGLRTKDKKPIWAHQENTHQTKGGDRTNPFRGVHLP